MAKRQYHLDQVALRADYEGGENASRLARRHGCSVNVILHRLREAGATIRMVGRRTPMVLGLSSVNHEALLEIVDGLLLGDGSLDRSGPLRLTQCVRRAAWPRQVRRMLMEIGVPAKIIQTQPRTFWIGNQERRSNGHTIVYTPAFAELKSQRTRWYPSGKKIVPADIRITPLSVSLWFCGDGSYAKTGVLQFCTQGFTRRDIDRLCLLLKKIVGIRSTRYSTPNGDIVAINRRDDAVLLRNFMGKHVSKLFAYKLRYVRSAIPKGRNLRVLTDDQARLVLRLRASGTINAELARKFGVSKTTIGLIVKRRLYKDVDA